MYLGADSKSKAFVGVEKMSLLSELKPAHRKKSKRLGRGKGSGKGGTSTKGHKGQKARSGARIPRGFEGGQMPLVRRLPKFGFTNADFKTKYDIVNLSQLSKLDGELRIADMIQKKIVRKNRKVKILGDGDLNKALTIEAHKFSRSAKEKIEKQGGKTLVVSEKR